MYKLTVPLESQQKNSTCWHASALMIWRYSQSQTGRAGPMDSLENKWVNNSGVTPPEFISLAQKVGLFNVPNPFQTLSAGYLELLLKHWGPLWCAGYWYGPGHIVVLTGVDADTVYINDPDRGVAKTGTLKWFNKKLSNQYAGCLMAKHPQRY